MKKLTIEEKAKAYDEAFALMQDCIPDENGLVHVVPEEIFQELKDNENEKMRKELIRSFKSLNTIKLWNGIERTNIIAWLENLGEQKSLNDVVKEITKNKETAISFLKSCGIMNANGELADEYKVEQDKQKPTDKVEPKFKIGDWIITPENKVLQITNIEGTSYVFNNESHYWEIYYCDKQCRLWTIEDEKDGDVLYCKSDCVEFIIMSRGVNEHGNIDSYFRYNSSCGFGIDIPNVLSIKHHNITPATKEQRDLLFQKMHEAGYEWDAEKKELKKIEQEPAVWNEEDEKKRMLLIKILEVNHPNGYFKVNPANTLNMEAMHTEELVTWLKDRIRLLSNSSIG